MNTPAHLIFGAAAFGQPGKPNISTAAIIGSLVPDLSLYFMVSWSIFVAGTDPGVVFGEYYYSSDWQQVFAIDNSFVFWGLGLGLALWLQRPAWQAFAGAGLLHLAFDFPLHNHDARMHFWPLSDWTFVSPLSYWDSRYHAGIIGPFELLLVLILALVLWLRHHGLWSKTLIALAVAAEIMASGIFRLFF